MLKKELYLQLFGEGGDGGDGSSAESSGESESGEEIPALIPERARKNYEKAVKANKPVQPAQQTQPTDESKGTEKMSYEDLIKSDDYKEQHKAYMDKTIGDRLKKYKGIESNLQKANDTLAIVAQKYGVDASSENFLEVLNEKIEADDSYYEQYAMEHDISTEDARKMVTMERKLKAIEAQKEEDAKQEQMRQHILQLQQNAEKTKQQFPEFNLELEMQDERFRRLCAVNNGDTTSAYMACHWQEIVPNTVRTVSRQAQIATSNAIQANANRPIEQGSKSSTPSVSTTDFSKMDLQQLRAWADAQRRRK